MKSRDVKCAEKHAIVDECVKLIGDKYSELCYKHDGCRILQSIVRFGSVPQRKLVVDKIKD